MHSYLSLFRIQHSMLKSVTQNRLVPSDSSSAAISNGTYVPISRWQILDVQMVSTFNWAIAEHIF